MTHGMKRFPTTVDVANISASSAGRERPTKIDALTAAVLASIKLFHWASVPHFFVSVILHYLLVPGACVQRRPNSIMRCMFLVPRS